MLLRCGRMTHINVANVSMSSSWQQSARDSRKWSRTWVLNCYWQSFSSCRPTLRLLKPTVVILCFTGIQFDFDERFLIECFFFLHLCFCWQGKENKSVGKSCLSFFLGFLLSLFDSRSYISPVERKEKRERQETQRYNTADVRAIYSWAIRQPRPVLFILSLLFGCLYSLVLEIISLLPIQTMIGSIGVRMMIDWLYGRRVCSAPGEEEVGGMRGGFNHAPRALSLSLL